MTQSSFLRPRWRWFVAAGVSLFLFAAGLFLHARIHRIDDYTRSWIVRALSQRFHSEVELSSLRVEIFPRMGVTGEGLSLYYNGRKDLPPLIQIEKFAFDLGILGIVRVPHQTQFIRVENMTITMPPAGEGRPHFPMKSDPDSNTSKRPALQVLLREIEVTDTALVLLPKQAGKEPLEWNLHNLVLRDVGGGRAFPFYGTLTNGKPKGEITTKGQIGLGRLKILARLPFRGRMNSPMPIWVLLRVSLEYFRRRENIVDRSISSRSMEKRIRRIFPSTELAGRFRFTPITLPRWMVQVATRICIPFMLSWGVRSSSRKPASLKCPK